MDNNNKKAIPHNDGVQRTELNSVCKWHAGVWTGDQNSGDWDLKGLAAFRGSMCSRVWVGSSVTSIYSIFSHSLTNVIEVFAVVYHSCFFQRVPQIRSDRVIEWRGKGPYRTVYSAVLLLDIKLDYWSNINQSRSIRQMPLCAANSVDLLLTNGIRIPSLRMTSCVVRNRFLTGLI